MKTGAQGIGRCLGLFCCPAIWIRDSGNRVLSRARRRSYAENLRQMRRTVDRRTGDGFLSGELLEVCELWLVSGRSARAAWPACPPGASPCEQVRMTHKEKETYNVEKMLRTDQSIKLGLCDCGGLRLTSGSVTVHFSREEFQAFAEWIGRIAPIVAQQSLGQAPTVPPLTPSKVCH